jgi:hypothetical protein
MIRTGAANRLACVAPTRSACWTNRDAENRLISATDAPTWTAAAKQ